MSFKIRPDFDDVSEMKNLLVDEQRWLFDKMIPFGNVSMVSGPGGVGKSTFTRALALSAITGRNIFRSFVFDPWLLEFENDEEYDIDDDCSDEAKDVIMLSAEDDAGTVLRSMKAIADLHRVPTVQFDEAIRNRLHLISGKSAPFLRRCGDGDWDWSESFHQLYDVAEEYPHFIIVDPLRRFFAGPENDNQHAGQFMETCVSLARDTDSTVLLVHHSDKKTGQPRGASAFRDESRAGFTMGSNKLGEVTLTHDKHNLGPKHDPVELVFDGASLREKGVDVGTGASSAVQWFSTHPEVAMSLGGLAQGKGAAAQELLTFMKEHHPDTDKKDVCQFVKSALSSGVLVEASIKGRNGKTAKILKVKDVST